MNNREVKFIIVRSANGLRHFKSQVLHHYELARENGFNSDEILECGLFLGGQKYILECVYLDHLKKSERFYIGNRLNFYGDAKLENWLKARDLESSLYYDKKPIGTLPNGD